MTSDTEWSDKMILLRTNIQKSQRPKVRNLFTRFQSAAFLFEFFMITIVKKIFERSVKSSVQENITCIERELEPICMQQQQAKGFQRKASGRNTIHMEQITTDWLHYLLQESKHHLKHPFTITSSSHPTSRQRYYFADRKYVNNFGRGY